MSAENRSPVGKYIGTTSFAAMAGLDRRSAARILKAAFETGQDWRGTRLKVILGENRRGGRSGRSYLVSLKSLPEGFAVAATIRRKAQRTRGPVLDHADLLDRGDKDAKRIADRFRAIALAADAPTNSKRRHDLIAQAAAIKGRSTATLYRWLADYEASGLAGLGPVRREARCAIMISRRFDRHIRDKVGREALESINAEFERVVKYKWSTRDSRTGMAAIARDVCAEIEMLCEAQGIDVGGIDCTPSLHRIRQFRQFELVHIIYSDARRHREIVPRIRRSYDDLAPMDVVIVDVKYCDVFVSDNGKRVRPALIGFQDAATRRLFSHFIKLEEGTGPTSAHVREALAAMLTHPNWGIPRALYTDNGPEMKGLVDGMALLRGLGKEAPVIRARPHNPQAKAIEGVFATLNKLVFSAVPGFTGGKPRKLTHQLGEAPPEFNGWDRFIAAMTLRLADYHTFDRARGRSPEERYRQKLTTGHTPEVLSPEDAAALFGHVQMRSVRQGRVQIEGIGYAHRDLCELIEKTVKVVSSPCNESHYILGPNGRLIALLKDEAYALLDRAGAITSDTRQDWLLDRAREMQRSLEGDVYTETMVAKAFRLGRRARANGPMQSGAVSVALPITEAQRLDQARGKARAELESWLHD